MSASPARAMQTRKGLINGSPNIEKETDEEGLRKKIDRMTYLAFAAVGIILGALLALYLVGKP